jgi:hypothetical protein
MQKVKGNRQKKALAFSLTGENDRLACRYFIQGRMAFSIILLFRR